MPYIIEPTQKQKHYAYDIAERLGIALPAEENIETYANFIAAHAKRYNAKRLADLKKKAMLAQENTPENGPQKETPKEKYVINQVESRLRLQTVKRLKSDTFLTTPEEFIDFMSKQMKTLDREHLAVLNLDIKNRPLNVSTASIGTLSEALVSGREIFKTAILSNAASIILYHNHPSGDVIPSKADITMTRNMIKCGKLLNIPVLDHVIIGPSGYYSFRKQNNLFKNTQEQSMAE